MTYEIQSRNDLSAGACLVIRFPEEDLDKKALYTIEADCPPFIVPFRHRSIDGEIECVYQLGERTKLLYRFGRRSTADYARLWNGLLRPILDCEDWFLKQSSFVLNVEYIFIGRDEGAISYLYVPSRRDVMGANALQNMAQEIAERNPVDDLNTENKVLREIMQGFRPMRLLEMLREGSAMPEVERHDPPPPPPSPVQREAQRPESAAKKIEPPQARPLEKPAPGEGDINIDFDGGTQKNKRPPKNIRPPKPPKPPKPSKPPKPPKSPKEKSLFNRNKHPKGGVEVIYGAPGGPVPQQPHEAHPYPPLSYPVDPGLIGDPGPETDGGETEVFATGFRLVGNSSLPRIIEVNIGPREVFTIGRFDAELGVKQSSFEFDKKTVAVSRHHAAIERGQDGEYTIVDLNSKAGTYVEGARLTPNIPFKLTSGCRVSFGTGGADYVWEE